MLGFDNIANCRILLMLFLDSYSFYRLSFTPACLHMLFRITFSITVNKFLCRCSTLLFAISDPATEEDFHLRHRQLISSGKMDALYNDDCIFSPGITVIKTDTELPHRLMEADRYHVDVITCAAPNLNPYFHRLRITAVQLKELHQQRARRILDIGVSEREDVMILGAFGCGAFRNPPEVVAEAYGEVIRDYLYDFKTIEFAVYCPPHSEGKNYHAFRHALTP